MVRRRSPQCRRLMRLVVARRPNVREAVSRRTQESNTCLFWWIRTGRTSTCQWNRRSDELGGSSRSMCRWQVRRTSPGRWSTCAWCGAGGRCAGPIRQDVATQRRTDRPARRRSGGRSLDGSGSRRRCHLRGARRRLRLRHRPGRRRRAHRVVRHRTRADRRCGRPHARTVPAEAERTRLRHVRRRWRRSFRAAARAGSSTHRDRRVLRHGRDPRRTSSSCSRSAGTTTTDSTRGDGPRNSTRAPDDSR